MQIDDVAVVALGFAVFCVSLLVFSVFGLWGTVWTTPATGTADNGSGTGGTDTEPVDQCSLCTEGCPLRLAMPRSFVWPLVTHGPGPPVGPILQDDMWIYTLSPQVSAAVVLRIPPSGGGAPNVYDQTGTLDAVTGAVRFADHPALNAQFDVQSDTLTLLPSQGSLVLPRTAAENFLAPPTVVAPDAPTELGALVPDFVLRNARCFRYPMAVITSGESAFFGLSGSDAVAPGVASAAIGWWAANVSPARFAVRFVNAVGYETTTFGGVFSQRAGGVWVGEVTQSVGNVQVRLLVNPSTRVVQASLFENGLLAHEVFALATGLAPTCEQLTRYGAV